MEVIEPAQTEWALLIVFVFKKDITLCSCVEIRNLNAKTILDSYPVPHMHECTNSLGDTTKIFALNGNSQYWVEGIAKDNRPETAFTSHQGLSRFACMASRVKNVPGTFQRAVKVLLTKVKVESSVFHLVHIVLYCRSNDEYIDHVRQALTLFHSSGKTFNLTECEFFQIVLNSL